MLVKEIYEENPSIRYPMITIEEINNLKNTENVILYGAGYIANEVAKVLEYNGIDNYEVVVTDTSSNPKRFRGRIVSGIKDNEYNEERTAVVVAISKKNFDSVMKLLEERKLKNVNWGAL